MSATQAMDLLTNLRERGLTLVAKEGRLRVAPKTALTPELREALLAYKCEILPLLEAQDPEVRWRVEAMRRQVPAHGPIPFLIACNAPFVRGACLSCGDALASDRPYRCQPCVEAAILALRESREAVLEALAGERPK